MQVTITIPDELAAQVQARGLELDTYISNLMAEDLSLQPADQGKRRRAVEATLRFADEHGFTSGGQNLKSIIHEGHKY